MIRAFVLQRVSAFFGSGSSNSPMSADAQKNSNRNAYNQQAAETEDDKPPDHPHDELGYQTPGGDRSRHLRQNAPYFPFADFEDCWNAATLFLSISTDPVSTKAGIGEKLSRDQSVSRCESLLW
jgi:hypothetical protein